MQYSNWANPSNGSARNAFKCPPGCPAPLQDQIKVPLIFVNYLNAWAFTLSSVDLIQKKLVAIERAEDNGAKVNVCVKGLIKKIVTKSFTKFLNKEISAIHENIGYCIFIHQ